MLVIHRSIASCDTFDPITEVDQDFTQGYLRREHDSLGIQRVGFRHLPSLFSNHGHEISDILVRTKKENRDHRLTNLLNHTRVG